MLLSLREAIPTRQSDTAFEPDCRARPRAWPAGRYRPSQLTEKTRGGLGEVARRYFGDTDQVDPRVVGEGQHRAAMTVRFLRVDRAVHRLWPEIHQLQIGQPQLE